MIAEEYTSKSKREFNGLSTDNSCTQHKNNEKNIKNRVITDNLLFSLIKRGFQTVHQSEQTRPSNSIQHFRIQLNEIHFLEFEKYSNLFFHKIF